MWFELIEGPGGLSPKVLRKRSRYFPLKPVEESSWVAGLPPSLGWQPRLEKRGELASQWWLMAPVSALAVNGSMLRVPVALRHLDVVQLENGSCVRLLEALPAPGPRPLEVLRSLDGEARQVFVDSLLELGDPLGQLLANPGPLDRARWLALLLLHPSQGELTGTWDGGLLSSLHVRFGPILSTQRAADWLQRLPRRLCRGGAGLALQGLTLEGRQFAGSAWNELALALAQGLHEASLTSLTTLEFADPRAAQAVHATTWERLHQRAPLLTNRR